MLTGAGATRLETFLAGLLKVVFMPDSSTMTRQEAFVDIETGVALLVKATRDGHGYG